MIDAVSARSETANDNIESLKAIGVFLSLLISPNLLLVFLLRVSYTWYTGTIMPIAKERSIFMHLNPDCMRDILLFVESTPFRQKVSIEALYDNLSYTQDEIMYACIKMIEADFISCNWNVPDGEMTVYFISDIRYSGHQFLADIRSDNIWNNVKEISKKIGSNSVASISPIASNVIAAIIKSQLGLI